MRTALGYALLGLLARRPSTGYDLTVRMHRPIGYFWTASHSQIYPELARLQSAGLVRHTVVDGAGPRPSKLYEITAAGHAELREWVTTVPEPESVRSATMVRTYSLWLVEPDAAVGLVERLREQHTRRLADYAEQDAGFGSPGVAGRPADFAAYATLRAGMRSEQAALEWCDWLLGELRGADGQASKD